MVKAATGPLGSCVGSRPTIDALTPWKVGLFVYTFQGLLIACESFVEYGPYDRISKYTWYSVSRRQMQRTEIAVEVCTAVEI